MGTLQKTVMALMVGTPAVMAVVPEEKWFARGSTIDAPEPPYVVLAWGGTLTSSVRRSGQLLSIYMHDAIGSYEFIREVIHPVIKPTLKEAQQYVGPDGYRLVQADYLGVSADLSDPDKKTGFVYSSWIVVGGEEA